MCGICGFTWNDAELAKRMTDVIAHRGPDQDGVYCSDRCSLGHRRLSILDLSENGRQPMSTRDGRFHIVFNGEIYNFMDIRRELEGKGYHFNSTCDTEVILYAYQEYGVDAIHKLRGMFAFAIWDEREKQLLLVRDRIGIKPLYYYHSDSKLVFGSEIKSILENREVPRELNHQALYAYLGFEFVPAPDTMFQNIKKLPAGHYLLFKDGQCDIHQYWDIQFAEQCDSHQDEAEVAEHIQHLIEDAVKARLISDVPLGAFLSGGLDSSAIVAMMRRHISGPLRTFTIGYKDKTFSELDYAQIIADQFETEHHILMIEEMNQQLIEKSLWHFDEPMTDLSSIPLMLICQQARKDVTVCLSGEGGDEVFAGYDRFKASRLNQYYKLIPSPLRNPVITWCASKLPDQPQKKGAINMLKRFIEGASLPAEGHQLRWQYFSNTKQDQHLFSDFFKQHATLDPFMRLREHNARCITKDRINRELYLDMRFMMADSVLMKVDKMSMANSLEIRVPLLDHALIEYLAAIPGNWKLKGFETKHIFRKALEGILPDNIVHRGKQGYSLPVKNFLRTQLKDYMVELLHESPVIRENMNMEFVDQLITEHMSMKHNHNHVLWGLMHTAIWHQTFFG